MEASPDPFETAWREVEANWDDDKAHRRFIAFCAAQGALEQAGRRYREVREGDAARSAEARRRIDAVLAAAMQNMQALKTDKSAEIRRINWVAVGLCVMLTLYGLLTLLRARSH
jgi:hypothetical protein